MSAALKLYGLTAPLLWRRNLRGMAGDTGRQRPAGQLVWIHAPMSRDPGLLAHLATEISEQYPDIWLLVTAEGGRRPDEALPDNCLAEFVPPDTRRDAAAFVGRWRPDVVLWLSGNLRPCLIDAAARSGAELLLYDTGNAFAAAGQFRLLPGLRRHTLRQFSALSVGDGSTEAAITRAGAPADRVHCRGVLEMSGSIPPCSHAERDGLAEVIGTRPVWLAASVSISELESVLAAHLQLLRRSHRLLLILEPSRLADSRDFAVHLRARRLDFARRSEGEEPRPDSQVYLVDTEGESGLWYRLAPVSFIGRTLAPSTEPPVNPFDAAALGSVVVHGPSISGRRVPFRRLRRARASMRITHAAELAQAVDLLLAPDRAAELAHAAWQISPRPGAQVMEQAVEAVVRTLDERSARA